MYSVASLFYIIHFSNCVIMATIRRNRMYFSGPAFFACERSRHAHMFFSFNFF